MSNSIARSEKLVNKACLQADDSLDKNLLNQSINPLIKQPKDTNIEHCIRYIFPDDERYIKGYN